MTKEYDTSKISAVISELMSIRGKSSSSASGSVVAGVLSDCLLFETIGNST
jgi:hypothetical protein